MLLKFTGKFTSQVLQVALKWRRLFREERTNIHDGECSAHR